MPLEDETTVPECGRKSLPHISYINSLCSYYLTSLSYSFLIDYVATIREVAWSDAEDMVQIFVELHVGEEQRRQTYQAWYSEAEGLACYLRRVMDQDVMLTLEFISA